MKRENKKRVFKRYGVLVSLGAFILLASVASAFYAIQIPDFNSLQTRKIVESTKIYDRTGEILLYDIHGDIRRTVIPFDKIPQDVKNATIAIEDENFYKHYGVSLGSIVRAFIINMLSGEKSQGGSTVTQQLVKKSFLTDEKTYTRKIKEAVLALKVESKYSKDEILSLYLNEIPYGSNAYGIEAASQNYFGKSAENLTLTESAYLAALPQAPTRLSPFGSHRDELETRKNIVLQKMYELGYINEEDLDKSKNEKGQFITRNEGIKAPHFVMYVKEYLVERYGEDVVERGGLNVTTTLNWEWQKIGEEIVKKYGDDNAKKYNTKNTALVATDPKTGQILVMVGSRDYFNIEIDGNYNIATAKRQPGSAFKPFVYATAFEKGYAPQTAIFDLPTEFNTTCSSEGVAYPGARQDQCYHPQNYDGRFRGPMTLKSALAQSINVPAVKMLYLVGISNAIAFAENLGITTLENPKRFGLSLVLGGGEVRLIEMTGAYAAFANDGVFNPITPILKVTDSSGGKVFEKYEQKQTIAMDTNVARIISDILSDNKARAPIFGEVNSLSFQDRQVAAKTGTTNNYRDAWIIGYTPSVSVGAWTGNNDNTPMDKRVAGYIVSPLWNAFFRQIFKDIPDEKFIPPVEHKPPKPVLRGEWQGGTVYKIDKLSGKLATEYTPEELVEEKTIREVHSILRWVDKEDPLGPVPKNPQNDPQYKNWEPIVRSWALNNGYYDESDSSIPRDYDDLHTPDRKPEAEFIFDPSDEKIPPGTRVKISIMPKGTYPIEQVDLFEGSKYLGSVKYPPFDFYLKAEGAPGDELQIEARVYDIVRNEAILEKTIKISEI